MYPVSTTFGAALRQAHTTAARLDLYYDGDLVESGVAILDGQVTINAGVGVRRTLDVTIADTAWWATLASPGAELRPYRGVRYPGGGEELVPLGVFVVDAHSMSVAPGGGIQVRSAPDRWVGVQRARFETPAASIRGSLVSAEIARLVTDAVPGAGVSVLATSSATVGALVYDRDRAKVVTDLLSSISAEAYFDHNGDVVIRDVPLLSQVPVWTVDASASGVLLGGTRSRDRSRTYNVVVVTCTVLDGQTPPAPVVVEDDDPDSATWVDGPMGRVPYFYASPVLLTTPAMTAAGRTILNRVKGQNAQLELDAVVHPGLDRGDVITAITADGAVERHLIASATVPLTVAGVQHLATQSTRPDGDVPDGE